MGLDALEVFSFLSSSSVFNSKGSERERRLLRQREMEGYRTGGGGDREGNRIRARACEEEKAELR